MLYLGLDPGASGGLGAISIHESYHDEWKVYADKWPDTERDIYNLLSMRIDSRARWTVVAGIEKVHAFPVFGAKKCPVCKRKPSQGVSSTFKFGKHYGFLRGILISLGIRFLEISPQTWQSKLKCRTKGNKNISKAMAQQLFPEIKITHATADALLIAEYMKMEYKIVSDNE